MSKHSQQVLNARNTAKFFGGKPLSGTFKQVAWAEIIRSEKFPAMTEEQAILVCSPTSLMRSAHFWIENRDKSGHEIGNFSVEIASLLQQYAEAKGNEDAEAVKKISAMYNELTAKWGFE